MDALLHAVTETSRGEEPLGPRSGYAYGDWVCESVWWLRPGKLCRFCEMSGPGVRYVLCRVREEAQDVTEAILLLLGVAVDHDLSKLSPGFYPRQATHADR